MGDFYQSGLVTTLHNLNQRPVEELNEMLMEMSENRPMALVIPSLYSELQKPALEKIVNELQNVGYLNEIVIGLDRASKEEFEHAKKYFSRLPTRHRVLWHDGPRLTELDKMLKEKRIAPNEMGKGRNAWYCFGYLIASGKSEAIALHDADIITYESGLLARLFFPVVNPNFNYRFCKGYYFRSDGEKLRGRVVRLLITPLLRTLKKFCGPMDYLEYLDSFRYPLAGEFSMRADVVKTIRIPSDWGLEIGILSEVQRNNSFNRICQVDIADRYDHKHQLLSPDDHDKGLTRMGFDIARAIYIKLAQNGISFTPGMFRSIRSTYLRIARDFVEQYNSDAVMNGLKFEMHEEEKIVDVFSQIVYKAGMDFLQNPDHGSFIPSWKRVMSAIPEYLEKYYDAVELDNQ